MMTVLQRPDASDSAERLAQARAHRRRWARDAVLLRTIDPDAVCDTAALGTLPDWVGAPADARAELAVLAGAVLTARRLRRTIEGQVLAAVAAAIGGYRLEAVLALSGRVPSVDVEPWGDDPVARLHALGGEVLVRCFDGPASVRAELAGLFPPSDALAEADPAALSRVACDAGMFWDWCEPDFDPKDGQ